MLNRTLNPFLFPFNPFSLTPPMPTLAAAQRMESVEVGLKIEDLVVNYGQIDGAGEAFFVEDLLVDDGDGFLEAETEDKSGCVTEDKTITSLSTITKPEEVKDVGVDVFGSVPADDVADLEWLSHFVEDSFSSDSMMTCQWSEPAAVKTPTAETSVTTPINTKAARTKRARTGGRIWSSRSSSTSSSDPPEAGEKKKRKKMFSTAASGTAVARRCSHCGVQKTPQWRAGPMGAKTLCNACGVRFKSGRLFPEYRPACSPTFSSDVHSNNHRKVLEMRMKQNKNKKDAPLSQAGDVEPGCFFKKLGELTG